MDFPFHRSQWAKPSASNFYEPTIARGIPVRPEEVKTATRMTPKVVQIPVHFVRSESAPDRFKPASIIQKIFRGFLTRKNVRKIMAIKKEVDEIEARIWWSDEVAFRKKDGKERLKVNEMLMALLFVLDSVLSVDSGVRNLRKAVIRKVFALQERVDAVAATAASADIDRIQPEPDTLAEEEKDHQARDQVLVIQHVAAAGANSSNSEGRPPEIQDLADGAVGNSVQKVHFSVVQVPQSSDVVDFENNGSAQGVDRGDDDRADSEMKAKDCVEDAEEFGIDPKMKVDGEACLDEVTLLDILLKTRLAQRRELSNH
nr:uncharacterized protein LOC113718659 [Coffea arabica]